MVVNGIYLNGINNLIGKITYAVNGICFNWIKNIILFIYDKIYSWQPF